MLDVEGAATFTFDPLPFAFFVFVDGTKQRATLGSFVHIPAGTKHSYRIATKSAKFVVVISPSGAKGKR